MLDQLCIHVYLSFNYMLPALNHYLGDFILHVISLVPFLSGGTRSIPRSGGIYNPSSVSVTASLVSSQSASIGRGQTHEFYQQGSRSDAWITSAGLSYMWKSTRCTCLQAQLPSHHAALLHRLQATPTSPFCLLIAHLITFSLVNNSQKILYVFHLTVLQRVP